MEEGTQIQEYEFDQSQNELLSDLAKKMNFVGLLLLIAGAINILSGLYGISSSFAEGFPSLVGGTITICIGVWTRKASMFFKCIVDTSGRDIKHLMVALGELLKLYSAQYWIILIGLIVMLSLVVVTLLVGVS
jgi:hypothetical protein